MSLPALFACCLALPTPYTPPLRKQWTVTIKNQLRNYFVVQGRYIFYGNNHDYGAINRITGKRLWETHFPKHVFATAVAADAKTLYVAVGNKEVRACDPTTGQIRWRVPLTGYGSELLLAGTTLFYEDTAGTLVALDTRTHRRLWRRPLQTKNAKQYGIIRHPIAQGERVFVGTSEALFCLDRHSGKCLWQRAFPKPTEKYASALSFLWADTEQLYVSTSVGFLALSPTTGKTRWKAASELTVWPEVLSDHGRLYLHSRDTFFALDAHNGHLLWSHAFTENTFERCSPPVLVGGKLLMTTGSELLAFSPDGKRLGAWDTEQRLDDYPITPQGNGLLLASSHAFHYLGPGLPLGPPDDPTARQALAQQLVARYGKWDWDDRTMFAKLGEAGFAALLPLVRAELQKPPEKALDRRDLLEHLGEVMSPAHTGALLELLPLVVKTSEIDYARRTALALLAEHGDGRARAFFWSELQKGPDSEGFGGAIPYFIRRPDPQVIAFLVDALDNPKASPSLHAAAFLNLPSMGDPSVLPNLRAARPLPKPLPTVADFYHMTNVPDHVLPQPEPGTTHDELPGALRATAKDEKGTLWGLFNCPAAGDYDDLWIARRQNNQWTEFLFTGASEKDFAHKIGSGTLMEFPPDWLKRYALNPALRVDSDNDGLTDVLEARLGTNPNNPDTDGDGLPDGQDKNPLAGKLPATDEEKILAAAFESYFGFSVDRGLPLIVEYPKGIAPFELPSAGWLVLPKASSAYWGTSHYSPRGHVLISFVDTVRHKSPLFRWNTDRTEATVHLGITYGAMDGIGYDLRVRKFGRDWFVVDQHAAWFS